MGAIPAREYLNGEYRMALAYLLCPTFQIVNSAGKPATGGYLEVYLAGSRTKYFCSSDFDGTRHAFQIPLDSLGSNVVLADDSNRYDVYVYNRYGTLLMSRYNVSPGAGGGAGFGVLTSSDGSVTIVETENGYDLTVNIPKPSVLRAGADPLNSDGQFVFHELVRDGDKITVDDTGKIRLDQGWYHYDITVRIVWDTAAPVNKTVPLQLYTTLASDVLDFDASYAHNDTVRLSGETKIASNGSELVFGITGLEPGMGAELVDMGVHAIYVSFGEEGVYRAGDYIDISPDKVISVTGVQPESAMTAYAPIVSLSSYVPTADFTSYSSDVNSAITSLSSDVSSIGTGISSISSMVSGLTGVYLEQSASALFAPSSLGTSKLDASASSSFAQASSLSGYIPTGESSNYQQTAGMTAYVPYSSVEGTGGQVTGINGSAIAGAAGHEYSGIAPIVVDNTAETISIQTTGLAVDADTMSAWVSGDDVVIGVKDGVYQPSGSYLTGLPVSASAGNDSAVYDIKSAKLRSQYNGIDVMPNTVRFWENGFSAVADYSAVKRWDSAYDAITANSASWASSLVTATGTATGMMNGETYTALTSVNGDEVSAHYAQSARYSNIAVNAMMDGNSRYLSALPGSSEVSSIASAYASGKQDVSGMSAYAYESSNSAKLDKTAQVVTATATKLYAGTAYLTGVNGAPISASRAGNAANASLANSAYYDGTGRLISSLPDRAEVSAIASAYATGGGGGVAYTSPSGTILVAGSTLECTNSAALTAASGGYFNALSIATFPNVTMSTTPVQLTYAGLDSTSTGGEFILDFNEQTYGGTLFISGRDYEYNTASASAEMGTGTWTASVPQGSIISQIYGWTDGPWMHLIGLTASAAPQVYTTGVGQLAWQSSVSSKLDTTAFSTVSGTFLTEVPPGYATETYVNSSVSSKLDTSAFSAASGSFLTAVPAGYATEAYVDSSVSGKQDSSAMSAYLPFSAISADENSAITSINGSSIGGGTQLVTSIETPVSWAGSSWLTSINALPFMAKSLYRPGSIMIGSGDPGMYLTGTHGTAYYKANEMIINRSGYGEQVKFNLGSAGAQVYGSAAGTRGAFMQMSNDNHIAFFGALSGGDAKIELDGYSAGSANMAGWDSTWNTVSSHSATWGDRTVLWSGTAINTDFTSTPLALSEPMTNFDTVKFYWRMFNANAQQKQVTEFIPGDSHLALAGITTNTSNSALYSFCYDISANTTGLLYNYGRYINLSGSSFNTAGNGWFELYRVVGINRTANN